MDLLQECQQIHLNNLGERTAVSGVVVSVILEYDSPQRIFSVGLCEKSSFKKMVVRRQAGRSQSIPEISLQLAELFPSQTRTADRRRQSWCSSFVSFGTQLVPQTEFRNSKTLTLGPPNVQKKPRRDSQIDRETILAPIAAVLRKWA